jgi:glutamate transport system permease protein
MVFATLIGFMMALGRLALNAPVRWAARTYVELFRTIPVVLFIFFAYFGLQDLGVGWVTALWGVVIGLTAYNSAVLAEIFRAGILSLDRGQSEAAYTIGLTYWQAMGLVILPQAVRRMTPAIVAQLATLTKDVSLGFLIGYEEVVRRGRILGEGSPSNLLQAYLVVGIIYFIVIFMLSRVARRLEVRQRRKYGAGKMAAGTGMEDIEVLGEEADVDEAEPAVS